MMMMTTTRMRMRTMKRTKMMKTDHAEMAPLAVACVYHRLAECGCQHHGKRSSKRTKRTRRTKMMMKRRKIRALRQNTFIGSQSNSTRINFGGSRTTNQFVDVTKTFYDAINVHRHHHNRSHNKRDNGNSVRRASLFLFLGTSISCNIISLQLF
jgi:hypothetical protein